MTFFRFIKVSKPQSLQRQIDVAEYQVQLRRRLINGRAKILANKINQRLADTTTLFMAAGIGFIVAEFTKCPHPKSANPANHSPLKIALTLLMSARTLYMALPVAWLMKSAQKRSQV